MLIYDRKNSDVTNKTRKGYYNYNDLNRIEEWCEYLKNNLNEMGYPISFATKTNWVRTDFPTYTELERIRTNIQKLMTGFKFITKIYTATDKINYDRANRYEKILFEIYTMMFGTEEWYVYSGVAKAGQSRLWQHRFRIKYQYFFEYNWVDIENMDYTYWNDFETNDTWEGVGTEAKDVQL